MGKGGGGGFDTSGMERATREGVALQERMYNEQKDMMQPWYRTGSASVGRLADLVGVGGGTMKTRDQIYNELKPQFGFQPASNVNKLSGTVYGHEGENSVDLLKPEDKTIIEAYRPDLLTHNMGKYGRDFVAGRKYRADEINKFLSTFRSTQQPQQTQDISGLNAAVDAQMASQQAPSDYGELTRRFTMQDFQADPGYGFRQSEGQRAIERAMAARGKSYTPEAVRAMQELNQGLASEEFTNAFNRRNIESENIFNRLATLSGFGQNATGQLASAGQNYASNVTNLNTSLANAQASAAAAKASRPSMFSQLLGTGASLAGSYLGGGGSLAGIFGRR